MKKRLLTLGTALLLGFTSLVANAEESAVEAFHRILSQHNTWTADFQQVVVDANGRPLQQTTGSIDLQKPDLFRWETDEPYAQLLVSDGKFVWLYDKDLEQVTKQPLDRRATATPALLLSNDVKAIEKSFDVQGRTDGNGLWFFQLKPKDKESLFTELRMSFKDSSLQEMSFSDSLSQQTRITFRNMEEDVMLPSNLFKFTPPEGVDLIEQN
ncbi:outer membrane lipoprotein chaperone LolA [Pokkaliibacter sp. CJK22405]|uniref:outer membrane lipoprotein chaperone LolA n=1 Tax=Pokkaliibacter sp. CJK22405 TaxID=3384615 RepID=UPI0039852707